MKTFDVHDYRAAVSDLVDLHFSDDRTAEDTQRRKVEAMQVAMLCNEQTRGFMLCELADELESLNYSDYALNSPEVQRDLWLLETYGRDGAAEEIRGWEWH